MSQRHASLYLDEDVDILIAQLVQARNYSATTAHAEGQLGRSDEEQMAYAVEHHFALVTHNRVDFEQLAVRYFNEGRSHSGIIIAVRRTPYEIANRLIHYLSELGADGLSDQVLYLRDG